MNDQENQLTGNIPDQAKAAKFMVAYGQKRINLSGQWQNEGTVLLLGSILLTALVLSIEYVWPGRQTLAISKFICSTAFVLSGCSLLRLLATLEVPHTVREALYNFFTVAWFLGYFVWFLYVFYFWLNPA